ncbi:MAG: nucleotidyltransferase family protein [Chloroflexi bacterium]|nr:nucleotidyltransferase family protein [Chloroflexota bacterium]
MNENACSQYSSIILSAGMSTRMKTCKQLLPWGNTTILGTIILTLKTCQLNQIIVVSGGFRDKIEKEANRYQVKIVFNERFQNGEMVDSLKNGLSLVNRDLKGVFIVLGDQPFISKKIFLEICACYKRNIDKIVIPSYKLRRAHPWFLPKIYYDELLSMQFPRNLRDFLHDHDKDICYINTEDSLLLVDLDTKEDYEKFKSLQH